MTVGGRIKARRKELGMTQVQLGEKIHKSPQVISNWERGYTTGITAEDLQKLSSALNMDIAMLAAPVDTSTTKNPSAANSEKLSKIAHRLRELRKSKNLTQAEVANQLHISKQSYDFYENGDHDPSTEMLASLADFYNVTTDYLLGRSDSPINTDDLSALSKDLLLDLKDIDDKSALELRQFMNYLKYKDDALTSGEKK